MCLWCGYHILLSFIDSSSRFSAWLFADIQMVHVCANSTSQGKYILWHLDFKGGVMEVLSCSDVQYGGDTNCPQRSGIKPSDDICEEKESSLLSVDCFHQRSGDGLSVSIHKGERTSLVVGHTHEMPGHDQSNSQQGSKDDFLNGTLSGEDILQKGKSPTECLGDELSIDTYDIDVSTQRVDSSHLMGCLSNGSIEMLPCFNVPSNDNPNYLIQEQVKVSENLNRADEFLLLGGDVRRANELPSYPQFREGELCGLRESSDSLPRGYDFYNSDGQSQSREPFSVSQSSRHQFKEESELSNTKQEGEVSLVEYDCPEEDETVALWVKVTDHLICCVIFYLHSTFF